MTRKLLLLAVLITAAAGFYLKGLPVPTAKREGASGAAPSMSGESPSSRGSIQPAESTGAYRRVSGQKFHIRPLQGRAYALQQDFMPPEGDAAQVVASLLPRAEAGDEIAAFQIYRKIASCRDDLTSAKRSAPSTDSESLVPADCRSIPADQWRQYTARWLDEAAERSFVPAQLLYAIDSNAIVGSGPELISHPEAVMDYRRKAMAYLNLAASTGNADALSMLSSSYANGVITKRDPMLAYAYFIATGLAYGDSGSAQRQWMRERLETGLDKKQVDYATQKGKQIYENCCSP
ncbi:MAG: hypothetical protein HOQ32_06125 [Lysobacter sp.]|nr:hypothetical protein [Lysobacter sp.]